MSVIYFDNFRGFSETFVPLKKINFFVGENSTGKTSILKLIGVLSSNEFWRYSEFGNKDYLWGNFLEIVNSQANSKDYFTIGILGDISPVNNQQTAIRIKFIENDTYPTLKEICYLDNYVNIQFSIEGKFLKYRYKIIKSDNLSLYNINDSFYEWISDNKLADEKFEKIENKYLGIIPIFQEISILLSDQINRANNNSNIPKFKRLETPNVFESFAWFSPVRAAPQRTYSAKKLLFQSEGEHTPSLLKHIIYDSEVKQILTKFGLDSALFDDIEIKTLGKQVADQDESEDFQIIVTLDEERRNIINVGYGVSQILPLVMEAIARANGTWFAIQQPEVHLHPKAQAAFGDFIYKSVVNDHQKFIIETHSDFTIDRFRLRLRRALKENKPDQIPSSQIVFFTRYAEGNKLETIEILNNGAYSDSIPKEFREFFIREQLELIKI